MAHPRKKLAFLIALLLFCCEPEPYTYAVDSTTNLRDFHQFLLGENQILENPSAYDADENGILNAADFTLLKRNVLANADQEWKLIWADEFDGEQLDTEKWGYDLGNWLLNESGALESYGWGNNEKQFYTDQNTSLSDGLLTISAKKESYTDAVQGAYDYTSSRLSTKHKFSLCGGKIEVRARMDSGKSLWPAIWMLPEDTVYGKWAASGEIDIMEGWGSKPDQICGTIHFGDTWPNNTYLTKDYFFENGTTVEEWHTYGIEWDASKIRWFVDGECFSEQTEWYSTGRAFPAPFNQNFYLILNLAVGGQFDGVNGVDADPSIFENGAKCMQVDYVRVYQKSNHTFYPSELPSPSLIGYFEGSDAELKNSDAGTELTIRSVGNLEYGVMGIYGGQMLSAGQSYTLSFRTAASTVRTMRVTVEDDAYHRYLDECIVLSDQKQHYSFTFTVPIDMNADIKFQLGYFENDGALPTHTVQLSDLVLAPLS